MAAALEETSVSYEDLAEIERDFDDAETEIIRQQVHLTLPLYSRRATTVSQIPNFWPLVLEQAPPDIDQYIQPSDSALLLSSLTSLDVSHFQLSKSTTAPPTAQVSTPLSTTSLDKAADPRSVSIRFSFSSNDYFSDATLEKKFFYRRSRNGWAGLVSEPVRISWKKGRDLTSGLLDLVCDAWEEEKASQLDVDKRLFGNTDKNEDGKTRDNGNGEKRNDKRSGTGVGNGEAKNGLTAKQKALKRKIEHTGMGGLSFFAWFGFIGRRVTAAESAAAMQIEARRRERRQRDEVAGSENLDVDGVVDGDIDVTDAKEADDDEEEDPGMSLEIFPDGDDLAVAITEDLWPGAIKYFTQAQEQDALSDADFESDDDDEDGGRDGGSSGAGDEDENSAAEAEAAPRPAKKQRT